MSIPEGDLFLPLLSLLTSRVPERCPFAVTVMFFPGTGGSGLTEMDSICTGSLRAPHELQTHPPPGVGLGGVEGGQSLSATEESLATFP